MLPTLFYNGVAIVSYDLMTFISIVAGAWYLSVAFHKMGAKPGAIALFIALALVVQDVGGMILPFLYRLLTDPSSLQWGHYPGRYFHSIFLSTLAFTVVYARLARWPLPRVLDHFMIMGMIVSPIGRIGCFMQGCCMGTPCSLPWAVTFPGGEGPAHPVQLYMLVLEAGILAWLLALDRRRKRDGDTFVMGVLIYSAYRFLIEFFRTNPDVVLGLSHAQLFSLATFAGVLAWLRAKKKTAPR